MPFDYIDLQEAVRANGLRMTVVSGIPSPWSEAAKGLLHIKQIPWQAVRHRPNDTELQAWTGISNAPVLMLDKQPAVSSWLDILFLLERLQPEPCLLPADSNERARMIGLSHELMGYAGLCWVRRLQIVHMGMQMQGEARLHAQYIAEKYAYVAGEMPRNNQRLCQLLHMFSSCLQSQSSKRSKYYCGQQLTAIDVYSAVSMALFAPLPTEVCGMEAATRMAFSTINDATRNCLSPLLLQHRDWIYEQHLELPLAL